MLVAELGWDILLLDIPLQPSFASPLWSFQLSLWIIQAEVHSLFPW